MSHDDHGVSDRVRGSVLASMLDAPPLEVVRHYQSRRARKAACGDVGNYVTDSHYHTTCKVCLSRLARRKR